MCLQPSRGKAHCDGRDVWEQGHSLKGTARPWSLLPAAGRCSGVRQLPVCMISSRQAGSFKEPFSQVGALNGSEAHWPPFPCGPFIYQEMKLVTGFLTLPNLTDEIWFLPEFRRSINSLLLSSTWGLGRGNPHHYQGLRTPQGRGQGLEWGANHRVGLGEPFTDIKRWPFGTELFPILVSSSFKLKR